MCLYLSRDILNQQPLFYFPSAFTCVSFEANFMSKELITLRTKSRGRGHLVLPNPKDARGWLRGFWKGPGYIIIYWPQSCLILLVLSSSIAFIYHCARLNNVTQRYVRP